MLMVQYVHTGKWWGRFSAQIFLEVGDKSGTVLMSGITDRGTVE